MFGIGFPELLVILSALPRHLWPGKLPEIGAALGKGIAIFSARSSNRLRLTSLLAAPGPRPREVSLRSCLVPRDKSAFCKVFTASDHLFFREI